jgi:hypothetical protein
MRGSRWLPRPFALVALAATLWVGAPDRGQGCRAVGPAGRHGALRRHLQRGAPSSRSSGASSTPTGSQVPVEPGSHRHRGPGDGLTWGVWQVGVDVTYAHHRRQIPVDGSQLRGLGPGQFRHRSFAGQHSRPVRQLQIHHRLEPRVLDGAGSRFGEGADIQATWSHSDGGNSGTVLSECSGASGVGGRPVGTAPARYRATISAPATAPAASDSGGFRCRGRQVFGGG